MENQLASGRMLSLFKSRPPRDYVRMRSALSKDLDTVSNLLLGGVSLPGSGFATRPESRKDWIARLYGKGEKKFSEEIRIATAGNRMVGAYALIFPSQTAELPWPAGPATLRFFALDPDYVSDCLVELLLKDVVSSCSFRGLSQLSVEAYSAEHPLIPALEKCGFDRVYGEEAENALLFHGVRSFKLEIPKAIEQSLLAQ